MADEFTLDEKDAISHAYSAGNYANAYESNDLDSFDEDLEEMPEPERFAWILGFFSSYELSEIGEREIFDEAYGSPAGRYVVHVAKYCDDRDADYAEEAA